MVSFEKSRVCDLVVRVKKRHLVFQEYTQNLEVCGATLNADSSEKSKSQPAAPDIDRRIITRTDPIPESSPQPGRLVAEHSVRAWIALFLLVLFTLSLIAGFAGVLLGADEWARTQQFLQIVLPAITGLLGGAIGFYYGSQKV